MAMRKSSRNYIHKRFDELAPEPTRLEGFVPIVPRRKEFVGELAKIIDANEGSSREDSRSCWIPFDEEYKAHRCELSDALRAETEKQVGGYYQPMSGQDLEVDLVVTLPVKPGRNRYATWDIACTFADAARFNAWTTDNKRLGLFAEFAPVSDFHVARRKSAGNDDPSGTRFVIRHADAKRFDMPRAKGRSVMRTVGQIVAEMGGERPTAPRMGVEREVTLMAGCMADAKTPLHPSVLRYLMVLRDRYDDDACRRLALFEQSRLDVALVLGGDAEAIVAEIDERTGRLLETEVRATCLSDLMGDG